MVRKQIVKLLTSMTLVLGMLFTGISVNAENEEKTAWIQWNGPGNSLSFQVLGTSYDPSQLSVHIDGTRASDNTYKNVVIDFKTAPFNTVTLPAEQTSYSEGEKVNITIPWMNGDTSVLESLFSGDAGFDPHALSISVYEGNSMLDQFNYTQSGGEGGGEGETAGCSLSFSNGTFTVSCDEAKFSANSDNTLLLFKLDQSGNPVGGPPVMINLYPPTVSEDGKQLSFTYDLLAELGAYIPAGFYKVQLMVDSGKPFDVSSSQSFEQVNKPAPDDLSVSVREEDKSIVISTSNKDYLDYVVSKQTRGGTPYTQRYGKGRYGTNTGIMLLKSDNTPVFFPDINGGLPLSGPTQNGDRWELVISADNQIANGLQSGDVCKVIVHAFGTNGPVGDDIGYENKDLGSITIGAEAQSETVKSTLINNLQAERIDIIVISNSRDYLANLNGITLNNLSDPSIDPPSTVVTVDPSEIQSTTDAQGKPIYTYHISMVQLSSALYGFGSGKIGYTLHSNGFNDYSFTSEGSVTNPFKNMPSDIEVKIIGEGFLVYRTENKTDSDGALEGIYNSSLTAWEDRAKIPVTLLNANSNNDRPKSLHMRKDDTDYTYTYDSSAHKMLIKTTYSTLVNAWKVTDPNASYVMNLVDPEYGQISMQNAQTLAPMIVYEAALNGVTLTQEELKNLDDVAVNKVVNINITDSESDTSGMNVTVSGEVAASAASNEAGKADPEDLNYDGDESKAVTVTTSVTVPTDTEMEKIETYQSENDLQETDVKFSVDIVKNSTKTGAEYHVTMLPYEAAMEFNLPTEPAPAGYHYVLLREHKEPDGTIVVEEIQWQNGSEGKGVVFTKKFSTFAMAIAKDTKPAPSDDSSKKSSSSGSAKKTSPVKTDNVVTCQMAGYPAGYAWNESAKACQPGFIDNAGVFHGTAAVKKAGVPNTYDKGLMGNVWALMISVVTGVAAAYALKKY